MKQSTELKIEKQLNKKNKFNKIYFRVIVHLTNHIF